MSALRWRETGYSAVPNPQPSLSVTRLPVGEGPGGQGAQLALRVEVIAAAGDEFTREFFPEHLGSKGSNS